MVNFNMWSRTNVFQILEFRADFIQPEDKVWGLDAGNLNWTGMVGMLQRYSITIESELLNELQQNTNATQANALKQELHI